MNTCLARLVALLGAVLLGACSSLSQLPADVQPGPPSAMLVAAADAPLARAAHEALELAAASAAVPSVDNPDRSGLSAVRGFPQGAFALDARIQLLRRAVRGIDLQTYHLATDGVGKLILRELRDAARRGVRARLLLDDWYTTGTVPLLLGLSLVQSARMNGHDPWAYLRDVLQRLPTLLNSRLEDLLPHRWASAQH